MSHRNQVENRLLADQFVGVYGPGGAFHLPPICHITRVDAKRLVGQTPLSRWCNRGLGLQIDDVDIICQPGILAFILPGDLAEDEPEPDARCDRDPRWGGAGTSLDPTQWSRRYRSARVLQAAALRVFWARVIIGAWRGLMRDTKGNPKVLLPVVPVAPLEL